MVLSLEEGFQTASTTCPTGAIQSFPLKLTTPASEELYDLVNDPMAIDFKWGVRANAPKLNLKGLNDSTIDEDTITSNTTTLTFNSVSYKVSYVQLTRAYHTDWVVPATERAKNKEDLIIVFESTSTTALTRYMLFCIPILREVSGSSPKYLEALNNPSMQGPFTLRSCFPENPNSMFAYYSSCISGASATEAFKNVYVFVAVNGVRASGDLMRAVLSATSSTNASFPALNAPFTTYFSSVDRSISRTEFTNFVLVTNQLLNAEGLAKMTRSTARETRSDDLGAYKCVPLDPEANIKDGKIEVDVETGMLLNDLLLQREADKRETEVDVFAGGTPGKLDPGRLEKYLSSALGIFLVILGGLALIFGVLSYWGSGGAATAATAATAAAAAAAATATAASGPSTASKITGWIQSGIGYIVFGLIVGFLGFIFGAMLS